MNIKKAPIVILLTLICFLIAAKAHQSDSAFERIKHSLPQREVSWKIITADGPCQQSDGSKQANYLWTNGVEEVSATVVLYKNLKAAKHQSQSPHKGEPSMGNFLIHGIGDEAYLFPPIILKQDGPYNLRFRKERYDIGMSGNSKDTVVRCAKYIADAISQQDRGIRQAERGR